MRNSPSAVIGSRTSANAHHERAQSPLFSFGDNTFLRTADLVKSRTCARDEKTAMSAASSTENTVVGGCEIGKTLEHCSSTMPNVSQYLPFRSATRGDCFPHGSDAPQLDSNHAYIMLQNLRGIQNTCSRRITQGLLIVSTTQSVQLTADVFVTIGQWSKGDIPPAFPVKRGYRPNTAAGGARTFPRLPQIQF